MNRRNAYSIIFLFLLIFTLSFSAQAAPNWQSVNQLVKQQKFSTASKQVDTLLKQAIARKDTNHWRRALIVGADFRFTQGKIETAVHFLQQQQWPQDKQSQLILNLYYAKTLSQYISHYSWEIGQRERIKTNAKTELKKMTQQQLVALANNAYQRAWNSPLTWKNSNIDALKKYFNTGTFPKRIRGTLRDMVTYLWIKFLGDEKLWTAKHSNQTYQLNLHQLLASSQAKINPSNANIHPLRRIAWLLANLETWHLHANRPEAAFEAARVRFERIGKNFNNQNNKKKIRKALRTRLQQIEHLPWVNMGRWSLAGSLKQMSASDALIQTKKMLDKCTNTHTNSEGSKHCQLMLDDLLAASFSLQAMKSDGIKKRSIEVTHNNIGQLYFRAWKIDLLSYIKMPHNQRQKFIKSLILTKTENHQWLSKLPISKDYYQHRTFITPPMTQLGYWVIAASNTKTFNAKKTSANAIIINLTKLTAELSHRKKQIEIAVYQGENGQLIPNAIVELWQDSRSQLTRKIAISKTDHQGRVKFAVKKHESYSVLIKRGTDIAYIDKVYHYQHHEQGHQRSALLFTDRSIYRPGQTLQWKVVAYQGNTHVGKFRTLPKSAGWVKLFDSNNKLVAQKRVTTNAYGSASGKFEIKQGRILGQWSIKTTWDSYNYISVEEYKRPTFSAKIDDSKMTLRLNHPIKLTGTASYYFGQKVTDGKVSWKVTRSAQFNGHWYRYRSPPSTSEETIATGTSKLNDKGQFTLTFLPQGDKRPQYADYVFKVSADITDSGGETHSARRSFRLGSVAINANINTETKFAHEGESYQLNISRSDLNGVPRSGSADWKLVRLQQPDSPILPAELSDKMADNQTPYATAGDKLKPRWSSGNNNGSRLANWKDGQQVRKGSLQHDQSGQAKLALKGLSAGAYRLHYTTFDRWKQRFTTQRELIIASKQHTAIQLPTFLKAKHQQVEVGQNIKLLLGSGFKDLPVTLDIYHGNQLLKRSILRGGIKQMAFPVKMAHRGGLSFVLTAVKDYQILKQTQHISVPWTDRQLDIAFSTFRDKLQPGQKEKWRITVKDAKGKPLETGAAEVLASMYDRSLDFFSVLSPPNPMSLYRDVDSEIREQNTQGSQSSIWQYYYPEKEKLSPEAFVSTILASHSNGGRHTHPAIKNFMSRHTHNHRFKNPNHSHNYAGRRAMMSPKSAVDIYALQRKLKASGYYKGPISGIVDAGTNASLKKFMAARKGGDAKKNNNADAINTPKIRTNFNETAFFYPHLALEKDGSVSFEFEVPESLTEWNVWVSAITRDLRGGLISRKVKTSKDLMVRPYLPRFLREGDRAEIEVVVNNSSSKALSGTLELEIFDPETEQSLAKDFKLQNPKRPYHIAAGQSTHLRFTLTTPNKAGMIAIRTKAIAGQLSDGEQRPLPILPSRIHLIQSRFITLHDKDSKILTFKELANKNDPTRINDKLVVTVEGQLFYSVLNALPYLAEYPYECTEQTLNRYLSTSIVKSVFDRHPVVASMAKKLSKRDSQYEKWNKKDANRIMLLEETPWLTQAEGGNKSIEKLFRILDPKVANAQRKDALQKLRKAQTKSGGFPWWPGGRASSYMTLYMLHGFSRALEFKSPVPKDMVQKAWRYLYAEFKDQPIKNQHLNEMTFINYLLSAYPDSSWTGGVFNNQQRKNMLNQSFKQWRELSPLLKSYLALTLHRSGQPQNAKRVFDSIMDSAKTDPQRGTYWAPEDRAWLWYNDSVDTHAFILRALTELNPNDPRRQGIVQWLMLDKKLNHWKSTRATAESIYALVHYLKHENQLAIEEKINATVGASISKEWIFKPNEYTGHNNQLVVEGDKIKPDMAKITIAKETKGLMFASATWHFSTEKLPQQAQGDFFQITRKFYKRLKKGGKWTLQPLAEGAKIAVGDQLEVQLSLRSQHNAEYVHLRAPRAAGYEPIKQTSGYQWQMGIGYYEEIRDSGANYFFDRLPTGEYSFKYQLRATMAGQFRTAPAQVQSVYAPEFTAYSRGQRLVVVP